MRLLSCLAVSVLLFQVGPLRAELATFQFSGRITRVGATPEFPELGSVFQVGRPYTVSYTFDLNAPDSGSSPSISIYPRAITAATFNYNNSTYVGVMDPATMSGSIRMLLGDTGESYTAIFGVGTNIMPTFAGDITGPTFPPVGGDFSHLRLDLVGSLSFLDDDALHPTLNFDAVGPEGTFMNIYFGSGSVSGSLQAFQAVPEPKLWLLTLTALGVILVWRRLR